jgi:hypothetical protein
MVELEPGRDHTTQAGSQGQGAPSLYLYCDAAALQSLRPLVVTYVASESTGSLSTVFSSASTNRKSSL